MKKISYWAKTRIVPARLLIIAIKLILAALACYTGILLYNMQIILPSNTIYLFAFIAVIIIIAVYPSHKKNIFSKKLSYLLQKSCDFILVVCSFLVICASVNTGDSIKAYPGAYGSTTVKNPRAAEDILRLIKSGDKTSLTHKEKRILKQEFVRQLKVYAVAKATGDNQKADDSWKIILVIIAAIGLAALLTALVCSLSCGGSDFAAVAVAILGLAAIIWGSVALIKRINRGK